MKMFFSSFLALAFLLPAIASADSYCVSFPTGGESKWSKRDNNIGVRFRYDYSKEGVEGSGFKPPFWASSGVIKGSKEPNRAVDNYTFYPYGTRDLCIDSAVPERKSRKVSYKSPFFNRGSGASGDRNSFEPEVTEIRLDVRWGADCGKVGIKNGQLKGNHKFEIYRRKGNHIDPFGCRKK